MNGRVELVSQAEYARRRGVAKSAVAKAVAEGRITLIDGKVDPAVADIQWAQNTRARADSRRTGAPDGTEGGVGTGEALATAPGPAAPGEPTYNDFRTRREKADAEMAERANLREAGLVLDRKSTERGVFDVMRSFRDAVQTVGPRAAPRCIGLGDARQIEHVITEEIRRALTGFEERLQGLMPPLEGAQ